MAEGSMSIEWIDPYDDEHGIKYLTPPRWDPEERRWTCLAACPQGLAVVEVNVRPRSTPEAPHSTGDDE